MAKEIKTEQRKSIGRQFQQIRLEQGWSVEQVALMAGVTGKTVEKVEAGVFNVPLDVLARMADVLGSDIVIKPKEGEHKL